MLVLYTHLGKKDWGPQGGFRQESHPFTRELKCCTLHTIGTHHTACRLTIIGRVFSDPCIMHTCIWRCLTGLTMNLGCLTQFMIFAVQWPYSCAANVKHWFVQQATELHNYDNIPQGIAVNKLTIQTVEPLKL